MELKAKDTYRLEAAKPLSISDLSSLWSGYCCLCKPESIGLFCLLHAENMVGQTTETHQHLCLILDMNIQELQNAFERLEQVSLIQKYVRESSDLQEFIYVLESPLTIKEFLSHEVLGRAFYKKAGQAEFEAIKQQYLPTTFDKSDFLEISAAFSKSNLLEWDNQYEQAYAKQRPLAEESRLINLSFDTKRFLRNCSTLIFPLELRTSEAVRTIEELGTVYGISEDQMIRLVGKCVNYNKNIVDLDMLRRRMTKEEPNDMKLPEDRYQWPCVLFLKQLQNGVEPADVDKRLLSRLVSELRLQPAVVNVLIEHVLNQNNMRLSKAYVEKIASTWVRLNITTVEAAKAEVLNVKSSKKATNSKSRTDVLPTYNQDETPQKQNTDRSELLQRIKKLGDKDGKN